METIRRNPLFVAGQTTQRLQSLASRLARAEHVALTGQRVHAPSDAPGRWGALHGLQSAIADHEIWQENLDRAQGWYDTAESALASAGKTVQQAWERAIQLSSEPYGSAERTAAAAEVAQLREGLLALANTRVGERSIFAGDAYQAPAFDAQGVYLGGPAQGRVKVGPDEEMASTFDGARIFSGGVDVFQALSDLEAALASDDPAAVAGLLGTLELAHRQLVTAREEVGFQQAQVSDLREVSHNLSSVLQHRLHDAIGVDPAEAYTELVSLQSSYQAALQVTASGSGSTLFDFLR